MNEVIQRLKRTPWDIVSMLIGLVGCAMWIIGSQHGDFNALNTKIDAFQAEMRDVHGRLSKVEGQIQ